MTGKSAAALLLALAVLGISLGVAQAAKDDLVFASRATGLAGAPGDSGSAYPSISADGRHVAFSSSADNLSEEDDDAVSDVFVRDLQTGTTVYASRGTGPGPAGDGNSEFPSLSADGRFVAFDSVADNLSAADDDTVRDVFVRDLETGATIFVSRATDDSPGDAESDSASISADGRYVAFESEADNLSTEDNDLYNNIFVRDLEAGTTTYVSRATAGTPGDDSSFDPSISADGRRVAFRSDANSLSDQDNDYSNVFVRDLDANTTTYASRAGGVDGAASDSNSYRPAISADGRHVSFDSFATTLDPADTDASPDIFVRDLQANTTTYVSRATGLDGAPADADSYDSSVSGDGRYVSFYTLSNNLSDEDDDAQENIFVRDVLAGTTTFVSRASGPSGAAGNGFSTYSSISADGRYVAFDSDADSLSEEDNNGHYNIFVRDVLGPPAGPGPPGPTPPVDDDGPVLSGRALTRGNGVIQVSPRGRFRLFCGRYTEPVTGTCGGRSARRVGVAQRPRRTLRLGRRSFTIPAGRRAMVRFRLSSRSLKALRKAKRIRMRGSVTARDALGNATTVSFRFTLRAPKARRR